MIQHFGIFIVLINSIVVMGLALWPTTGQMTSIGSSLANVQVLCSAVAALLITYRVSRPSNFDHQQIWFWLMVAVFIQVVLILNVTHTAQISASDNFEQLFYLSSIGLISMMFAVSFIPYLEQISNARLLFGTSLFFGVFGTLAKLMDVQVVGDICFLVSSSSALILFIRILQLPKIKYIVKYDDNAANLHQPKQRSLLILGVVYVGFTLVFLQTSLYQSFLVLNDYLTAQTMLAFSLIGMATGGMVGWLNANKNPKFLMVTSALTIPFSIAMLFSVISWPHANLLLIFSCLLIPFASASCILSVVLSLAKSHHVWFTYLLGGAIASMVISLALPVIHEEGMFLVMSCITAVSSIIFILLIDNHEYRVWLTCFALAVFVVFLFVNIANYQYNPLHFISHKIESNHPNPLVVKSLSSINRRYDVLKVQNKEPSVLTFRNGIDVSDLIEFQTNNEGLDPRLPVMADNQRILLIGLTNNSLLKQASRVSNQVLIVEPDKSIVELKRKVLAPILSDPKSIGFTMANARNYLAHQQNQFDLISIIPRHLNHDCTYGRMSMPERLHTYEAIRTYINSLSAGGMLTINESISQPRCEPALWKLVYTMRQVMLDHGYKQINKHFFVFTWHNQQYQQVQIVMKKSPLTEQDVNQLIHWHQKINNNQPRSQILYQPFSNERNNYSDVITGKVTQEFLNRYNITLSKDDKPFYLDTDPSHQSIRGVYFIVLKMALVLIPFIGLFILRYRNDTDRSLPIIMISGIIGLAFILTQTSLFNLFGSFLENDSVSFVTVMGSLLFFCALGSLFSRNIEINGVYNATIGIIWMLAIHLWYIPSVMAELATMSLSIKIAFSMLAIAPLAFLMGIPFPYFIRISKVHFSVSSPALLFAIYTASGAVAITLSLFIAASYGYTSMMEVGIVSYVILATLFLSMQKKTLQRLVAVLSAIALMLLVVMPIQYNPSILTATEQVK